MVHVRRRRKAARWRDPSQSSKLELDGIFLFIIAQNFSKPCRGNKQEKGCQEKNCHVCTVDHGDVLALLDSHLFKLLDSHPENHDGQNERVSSRSNQDGEATKEKQKDIFKDRPKTFYPVSAADFVAYVHQVSEQQQI